VSYLYALWWGIQTSVVCCHQPGWANLASSSEDKTIKLMAARYCKLLHTLKGIPVLSVAISPGGQTLASGSADRTIKVWHLATGELLSNFTGHTKPVWSVAFSTDKQTLASGSGDNHQLWLVSHGKIR